ncbi:Replication protein A 70 kDa DNA-binding subunit B [Vitis vinifera]|uniref:Replication protein A 70 kDa DNA-binding subunit B n=1 Tax=Vitis vinifera TaxID=29760 RepID=A0A438G864_VITVI|nr:Replication protein A 70 kDa DNA-binding subunit B [Vitis vinifera]
MSMEGAYVSGVVQSVSPTMRIRRKSHNDIKKTVVVSLWNDHATNVGQELLDNADKFPIVAIKSLKVGDFQGMILNVKELQWLLLGLISVLSSKGGVRSMYYDRVSLSHVTSNPYWVKTSIRAYISFIKPDQTMWYRACKTCNKKVTGAIGSGYWCEGCQKNDDECSLRYIMVVKVSNASG